jgi:hypothetical protein
VGLEIGEAAKPSFTVEFDRAALVRWVVTDVALIHSRLGEIRHTVLGRWPLRG